MKLNLNFLFIFFLLYPHITMLTMSKTSEEIPRPPENLNNEINPFGPERQSPILTKLKQTIFPGMAEEQKNLSPDQKAEIQTFRRDTKKNFKVLKPEEFCKFSLEKKLLVLVIAIKKIIKREDRFNSFFGFIMSWVFCSWAEEKHKFNIAKSMEKFIYQHLKETYGNKFNQKMLDENYRRARYKSIFENNGVLGHTSAT